MAVGLLCRRRGGWTLLNEEKRGGEIMADRGRTEIKKERMDMR